MLRPPDDDLRPFGITAVALLFAGFILLFLSALSIWFAEGAILSTAAGVTIAAWVMFQEMSR